MSGNRVHRLDLAAKPSSSPGINQHCPGTQGVLGRAVGIDRAGSCPRRPRSHPKPTRHVRCPVPRLHPQAGGRPRLQPTVEHPDTANTGPAQQPPGACSCTGVPAVVDHHGVAQVDPNPAPDDLKISFGRQWVTAGGAITLVAGQFRVQVDEESSRDMPRAESRPVGTGQTPSDVKYHRGRSLSISSTNSSALTSTCCIGTPFGQLDKRPLGIKNYRFSL